MVTKTPSAYATLRSLTYRTQDLPLNDWTQLGITKVTHLLREGGIQQFPDLQQTYALPSRELFIYMRIKHIEKDKLNLLDSQELAEQLAYRNDRSEENHSLFGPYRGSLQVMDAVVPHPQMPSTHLPSRPANLLALLSGYVKR
ncbi:Hypothetical predicted protein [Pelobates cultripes]|uniref:Uncharacterized protein n=1 Tax=Pelobates cultripes TaxID=61616 RepID=A0AAD1RDT9_PELCU|nr:Hypothetical predicted protein [Pelobates cultripes]